MWAYIHKVSSLLRLSPLQVTDQDRQRALDHVLQAVRIMIRLFSYSF